VGDYFSFIGEMWLLGHRKVCVGTMEARLLQHEHEDDEIDSAVLGYRCAIFVAVSNNAGFHYCLIRSDQYGLR